MKNILLSFSLLTIGISNSLSQTWASDVAQVFYDKCTSCHHAGGIAPFPLMDYAQAYNSRIGILGSVAGDRMPPWTADTSYQKYSHARFLSSTQKSTILDWINNGSPSGNLSQVPAPPVYNGDAVISATPDLQLQITTYTSKATSVADDYVCFTVPTGLIGDKKIKAVEVIPGNRETVHHALIYKVDAGTYPTDTSGFCGGPTSGGLIAGYTPGSSPTVFPGGNGGFNSGIKIKASEDIVFAMHYPSGSAGSVDSTKVNFYFYPDNTPIREISAAPLLSNWNFCVEPNEIKTIGDTFELGSVGLPDLSMLSVFPHMHLIGQSIKAYSVSPLGDTTPFIDIPIWDFDWQDFYFFKNAQKVPAGSKIYGSAVYNNVAGASPHYPNPNPVRVCDGLNTTDEMFLIYFHVMGYEPGDENINVDSLNSVWLDSVANSVGVNYLEKNISNLSVYPNPFKSNTTLNYTLTKKSFVGLTIYDTRGKMINRLKSTYQAQGKHQVVWNGNDESGKKVSNGLYHYSMVIDGKPISGKLVLAGN